MNKHATIPSRNEVKKSDQWDLSSLYKSPEDFETALGDYEALIPQIAAFKNTMATEQGLLSTLEFYSKFGLLEESLGNYASLRKTEDEGNTDSQGRLARFMMAATRANGEWAFFTPSLQALPESLINSCLADPRFGDFKIFIQKLLRFKPHILSEKEEKILALQIETNGIAREAFSTLTNVDFDFGKIATPEGERALTQSSFASLLRSPDRDLRRAAYKQFYAVYDQHKNTIATLYAGAVKLNKYHASVRGYPSARAAALFPDKVEEAVYDNLVGTINANLGSLHEYYTLRKKILKLNELRHYDVYVPLVHNAKTKHSYEEAVELVCAALAPLGSDYVATMRAGLLGSWVDRYENKGKRSGAFSSGSYKSEPFILLNYKDDVLRDVFTLAHEAGHSMHSYLAAKSNTFLNYGYTIFEAEVASTFNEQLLFTHLYKNATSSELKASLLANKIDDSLATLFRQTMFAEYEAQSHAMLEAGQALTVDSLRSVYKALLLKYFGPELIFENESDLECLRIPHFYGAFYVYKYATGISASTALAQRVLEGGAREREDYFNFLKSGGSRYPIESLKIAGVDMASPEPVKAACAQFARDVAELKKLLGH